FAKPAVGPLFVNIFIIGGILLLYDSPIENLGFAVIFGAAVQLIWLFCLLFSSGISAKNAFSRETFKSEIFMVFLKQTAPVAMWIFLTPIVPLFERYLMSLQQEGSVAILNYTDKILYLPLGVISISLANAAFPNLSLAVLEKRNVRIELLEKFLWLLVICMFPIQVLMNSCSLEISQIIYQRGQFGELESRLTTDLLSAYSWSLIPVSGTLLLNRLFFAAGQFKIPFFAGLVTILLQLSADAFLVPRFGPIGIGWGASIASIFQTTALLAILGFKSGTGVAWYCAKPLFLALILAEGFNLVLPGFFYQLFVFLPSGKMGSLLALSASWVLFQTFSILFFRYGLPRTKSCEV
ncbi:hypothetical protein HYY75_02145, partial [bacterium]|nr:hypothetical protein [bacterium]